MPKPLKGGPSLPEDLERVNLPHFKEMINRLVNYVDEIDTATSLVEEWHEDMDAELG